ncbi:hypothetical protein HY419_02000 [candidate division WWE3 bacterium]|nr:hypothetical protein [candidate division WWE3 bacterium]
MAVSSKEPLYHIVYLFLILIPFALVAPFFVGLPLAVHLRVVVMLTVVGFVSFFIDLFLQNILEQDLFGKMIYTVIILSFVAASYFLAAPSFKLLVYGRTEMKWLVFSGVEAFAVVYWVYYQTKKFFKIFWDLDVT